MDPRLKPFEFSCPRCETTVTERFYGPCEPCRLQLREFRPPPPTAPPEPVKKARKRKPKG